MSSGIADNFTQQPNTNANSGMVDINSHLLSIVTTLITSVGLIGNALNFLVLHAYHTSQIACAGGEPTARLNLLGLAIADFFVCFTTLPLTYVKRQYNEYSFMAIYTVVGPALATYFLTISAWMVLLMSFVRYLAVCQPLTSRSWLTPRNMLHIIIGLYITAGIMHIPTFLWHTFEEHHQMNCSLTNLTLNCPFTIVVAERWPEQSIQTTYHVISIILTNIGPFIGVVLSYLAVIRACRRSDQCRRSFIDSIQTNTPINEKNQYGQRFIYQQKFNKTHSTEQQYGKPFVVLQPQRQLSRHSSHYKTSLQKYPNMATNRVTPLLLAVIFAFLLFTAPFGIVHFVCMRIMIEMGTRLSHDSELRELYRALNLTVSWTNVIQLLGSAANFFLYFLVSTIFRRTTKRTFLRIYERIRSCQKQIINGFWIGRNSRSTDSWVRDERTNELRRELEMKFSHEIKPKRMLTLPDHGKLMHKSKNQSSSSSKSLRINDHSAGNVLREARELDSGLTHASYSTNCDLCQCVCNYSRHVPCIMPSCAECERSLHVHLSQSDNHLFHIGRGTHWSLVHSDPSVRAKIPATRQYRSVGEVPCTCINKI